MVYLMSWDKAIDKKVRSSDDQHFSSGQSAFSAFNHLLHDRAVSLLTHVPWDNFFPVLPCFSSFFSSFSGKRHLGNSKIQTAFLQANKDSTVNGICHNLGQKENQTGINPLHIRQIKTRDIDTVTHYEGR
jgi:hypothetical protein